MFDSDQQQLHEEVKAQVTRAREERIYEQERCSHTQPRQSPEMLCELFPREIARDLWRNDFANIFGQYSLDGELCVCCNRCRKQRTYTPTELVLISEAGSGDELDEVVRRVINSTPHWFGRQIEFGKG